MKKPCKANKVHEVPNKINGAGIDSFGNYSYKKNEKYFQKVSVFLN